MKVSKAFGNFVLWVSIAIAINVLIFVLRGERAAVEFLGGYIIEMSLSMDNLFLFLMVFNSFGLSMHAEARVLDYGIFVAMLLRMVFIFLGVKVVNGFHSILYIFGIIIFISALNIFFKKDEVKDFRQSKIIKILKKIIPFTNNFVGDKFFVKNRNKLYATPLLAVLIVIELSDIMFAIDSIPAIFSITTDPTIVYVSNICAVICLRSMYFLLAKLNNMFKYVKYGVAFILMFTGVKLMGLFFNLCISNIASILIILMILLTSILISFIFD